MSTILREYWLAHFYLIRNGLIEQKEEGRQAHASSRLGGRKREKKKWRVTSVVEGVREAIAAACFDAKAQVGSVAEA